MKRFKYIGISLFTFGFMLIAGCEKALEVDPMGRIPKENVFENETYVRSLLNSIYTVVGSGTWNSGRVQKFNELLGDQYFG